METKELVDLVNRLQEENRRIKQTDSYNHSSDTGDTNKVPKNQAGALNLLNESDFQKMKRLRGQMEKQRDELMCRDQEIEEKNTEIENVRFHLFEKKMMRCVNTELINFFLSIFFLSVFYSIGAIEKFRAGIT